MQIREASGAASRRPLEARTNNDQVFVRVLRGLGQMLTVLDTGHGLKYLLDICLRLHNLF